MRPSSNAADAAPLEVRQNKKSKWDKVIISAFAHICNLMIALMLRNYHFDYFVCFQVDGDGRNLLIGGQDSLAAAAAAQAALLSAANVGSGYTGFV
jgi:hypothetical protein